MKGEKGKVSAYYDNMLDRLKETDPEFVKVIETVEEGLRRFHKALGVDYNNPYRVIVTEDTTEEEAEMQCIECFLKQGATIEEAERYAKEWMEIFNEISEELDTPNGINA